MKLVPEHIDEAIKHLQPFPEETMFGKSTDKEIYDLWNDGSTDFNLSLLCVKELKKRKATTYLEHIKNSEWYLSEWPDWPDMTPENKEKLDKILNENIKHLSPRSEEEIEEMFQDICNEIADNYDDYFEDYDEAYFWAQNHRERILELVEREYSTRDIVRIILYGYDEDIDFVRSEIDEAIKHLQPRTNDEVRKYVSTIIKPFYERIKQVFKNYDFKGYDISLEDDDTCIHIEKNGQIKFRIYYVRDWERGHMFSMYIYKNGKYHTAISSASAWGFAKFILDNELNEGIKHLSGHSEEEIKDNFKNFSIVQFYDLYWAVSDRESLRNIIKYFPILFQIAWKIDKFSSIHYSIEEKQAYVRIFKGNTTIIDLEQSEGDSFAVYRTGRGEYKINSIKDFNDKTGMHLIEE